VKPSWLRAGWALFAGTVLAVLVSRATGHPAAWWAAVALAAATLAVAALAPRPVR